jgi:hypothetical protein
MELYTNIIFKIIMFNQLNYKNHQKKLLNKFLNILRINYQQFYGKKQVLFRVQLNRYQKEIKLNI